MLSLSDKTVEVKAQEQLSSPHKKVELEAQDEDMLKYFSFDGLMASVTEGSIKPLSGRYLVKLAGGQRAWLGEVLFDPSMVCPGWVSQRIVFLWRAVRCSTKSGGERLEKRQDLPDDAFLIPSARQLKAAEESEGQYLNNKKKGRVDFVALSYRWISAGKVEESVESYMT